MSNRSSLVRLARLCALTLAFWILLVFTSATSDVVHLIERDAVHLNQWDTVRLDERDVETFRIVQSKFGFVFVQVVNHDYLPLVLNWVCGVPSGVLEKTVFVTSEERMSVALSRAGLQQCLVPFRQDKLTFGDLTYYRYMMYRTLVVEKLLKEDVSVWIVESDATWFADPSFELEHFQGYDILAGSNQINNGVHELQAGFIFLNTTDHTRQLWSTLRKEQQQQLTSNRHIQDAGNEMNILQTLLTHVRFDTFDRARFVSGQWYDQCKLANFEVPTVIQNNFIIGNEAKIKRMQKWGHWFLTKDFTGCPATIRESTEYFLALLESYDMSLFPNADVCL